MKLPTAKEMHNRIKNLENDKLAAELQVVNEALMDAKTFKVNIDGVLSSPTKVYLEGIGYVIKEGGRYNERDTVITFEEIGE